jgi:predicted DNA-binding transcriptional regulator YafY
MEWVLLVFLLSSGIWFYCTKKTSKKRLRPLEATEFFVTKPHINNKSKPRIVNIDADTQSERRILSTQKKIEDIIIEYSDVDGVLTERRITPVSPFESKVGNVSIEAWCHLRSDRRTFRVDRILSARWASSGQIVKGFISLK